MRKNIAIIGSGTGLFLAWLLKDDFDVVLFEKSNDLGGHANSMTIENKTNNVPKNTNDPKKNLLERGAEFVDERYRKFLKLLKHIGVKTNKFLMSMEYIDYTQKDGVDDFFKLSLGPNILSNFDNLDKSDNKLVEIFKDAKEKIPIVKDIIKVMLRFKTDKKFFPSKFTEGMITLEKYLNEMDISEKSRDILHRFVASFYGVRIEMAKRKIANAALDYLIANPIFHELIGGMGSYIGELEKRVEGKIKIEKNCEVKEISRQNNNFLVRTDKGDYSGFDEVVICTNAKIASKLIKTDISDDLEKVEYYGTTISFQENKNPNLTKDVVVHIEYDGEIASTTALKSFNSNYSKKWCIDNKIPENSIAVVYYEHPTLCEKYLNARKKISIYNQLLTGISYGSILAGPPDDMEIPIDSHESGINASLIVAKNLGRKYNKKIEALSIFDDNCCC